MRIVKSSWRYFPLWLAAIFSSAFIAYEVGLEIGRTRPAACPNRNLDGKILTKITFDGKATTCIYESDYTGSNRWKLKA